jgi:hypothetical protein
MLRIGDHMLKNMDLVDFSLNDAETNESQTFSRVFYPFYVGIDIGSDFHVAACIPFEKFRIEKE